MDKEKTQEKEVILTAKEEEFCQLYVMGGSEFAGNHCKCYREVFGQDVKNVSVVARRLRNKPHILAKVKELSAELQSDVETMATKIQISETLKAVMEETATAEFSDRWGIPLSPAPLRAVSVNAAKALMDMYPIKHAHEAKLKIEGTDNSITFNVIVPENKHDNES